MKVILITLLLLFWGTAQADEATDSYECYTMHVDKYRSGTISYESFKLLIAVCVTIEKRSWYDRLFS